MKELIEVKIGETVEVDDELYTCVKDDPTNWCSICAFYNTYYCCEFACASDEREDKTGVHFE